MLPNLAIAYHLLLLSWLLSNSRVESSLWFPIPGARPCPRFARTQRCWTSVRWRPCCTISWTRWYQRLASLALAAVVNCIRISIIFRMKVLCIQLRIASTGPPMLGRLPLIAFFMLLFQSLFFQTLWYRYRHYIASVPLPQALGRFSMLRISITAFLIALIPIN